MTDLDPDARPAWAKFMTDGEWRDFAVALVAELVRRGSPYRVDDGVLWGRWGSDEDEALGLTNLAQLCHASTPGSYPEVIASHFDALVAGRGDRALAAQLGGDLNAARPLLRLRLYARDTFTPGTDHFVLHDVADDLTAVLCYDLPSNVVTVTGETVPRWGVSPEELYYQALANQRRTERAPIEEVDVGGGAMVRAMTGDSYFVASNLLLLRDFVTDDAPLGVIAAVPNRHTLLWHVIGDANSLRALDAMVVMAANLHGEGPGAITPNLYWWRDDTLRTLPTRETDEHYEFVPPDDFVDEVLEVLAERAEMN
ncbi:MAG: hypothetical protein KBG48_06360 [Kofleriaceae bacterium]|nr:hypothetical protein [Kofleriaceae bacterium]MBP9166989.1 hypothetical protein [Kofleriaceae bacterium]MBP9858300.1 hypothetical protein [Kofleriaceae bacterium]